MIVKNKHRLFFLIINVTIIAFFTSIFSQNISAQPRVIAKAIIMNNYLIGTNTVEFDLYLTRETDDWKYWANGTFQFDFDSLGYSANPTLHSIELVSGSSDLDVSPITGQLPTTSYYITPRVFTGRFSITIAGPETYQYSKIVPLDSTGIRLGRFRIRTLDNSRPPINFKWLAPFDYYQACAFKIDEDLLIAPNIVKEYANSNIEMYDRDFRTVEYVFDKAPEPAMIIKNFKATYVGRKKVLLTWETESEAFNKGFIIARVERSFEDGDAPSLTYTDTIADYRLGYNPHDSLIGLGTTPTGKKYYFMYDSVPYVGLEYCWELMYEDFFSTIHGKIDYDCIRIPNAVIVFAQADPNPFNNRTKITYIVSDDLYLSCFVNDLQGKLVNRIYENEYRAMGKYDFELDSKSLAQQGLYNVVFLGIPIDDPTVEISNAVLKIQLVK